MSRKQTIRELESRLDSITRQLDSIYTALVIRDPGTPLSAETYEGLRRQVIAGAQERMAHLVQLADFDVALRSGADVESLLRLTSDWLRQAGIAAVDTAADDLQFETPTGDGPWEVALPAYVDTATGRIVRQGRLRAAPATGSHNHGVVAEPSLNVGSGPMAPQPSPGDDAGGDEPT